MAGTNRGRGMGSIFAGVRASPNVDIFAGGVIRSQTNYQDGNAIVIPGTNNDIASGLSKVTVRPLPGHEIKLSGITYDSQFDTGQKAQARESVFGTHLRVDTLAAKYRYARPDDRFFDFDGTVYWNRTDNQQTKIANGSAGSGNAITGFVGDKRSFMLTTTGFDANNTTRFETGSLRHALTYGGDHFFDHVNTFDRTGTGDLFTPSGDRSVSGAFVQLKTDYSTWLQVIGAVRYDAYKLEQGNLGSEGDRFSPKITVGITPVQWLTVYGTYAEGYRAPAITEALVAGSHPPFAAFPGAPPAFTFVPNTSLKPEIGKNKEVGVNLRFDDIWFAGDRVRIKANYFVNDLEDYIRLTPFGAINLFGVPEFAQYRNTPNARIEGFEFEGTYDAGSWFAGLSAHRIRGTDISANLPIATIPPDEVAATFGLRFLDQKLTTSIRWAAVAAKSRSDIPDYDNNGFPDYLPTESYNLVNVYLGYKPTEDVLASFGVDNVLNQFYIPYLSGLPDVPGQSPGVKFAGPGITYKGSLKIRFAAM
jgi:hemoglobin/transferrin/lactoferrin receptor protein